MKNWKSEKEKEPLVLTKNLSLCTRKLAGPLPWWTTPLPLHQAFFIWFTKVFSPFWANWIVCGHYGTTQALYKKIIKKKTTDERRNGTIFFSSLTINTPTSVHIIAILFSIYFLRAGEANLSKNQYLFLYCLYLNVWFWGNIVRKIKMQVTVKVLFCCFWYHFLWQPLKWRCWL